MYSATLYKACMKFHVARLGEVEMCKGSANRMKCYLDMWFKISILPDAKEGSDELIIASQLL